jgi:hypothetical protein
LTIVAARDFFPAMPPPLETMTTDVAHAAWTAVVAQAELP